MYLIHHFLTSPFKLEISWEIDIEDCQGYHGLTLKGKIIFSGKGWERDRDKNMVPFECKKKLIKFIFFFRPNSCWLVATSSNMVCLPRAYCNLSSVS